MQSFFSKMKNMLSADFGGRYLAFVLTEVIRQQPRVAQVLWQMKSKILPNRYIITEEWSFPGSIGRQRRRADLALLDPGTGDPLALLEIKYEDQAAPKNAAQLQDYLDFCGNIGIPFVYLTKHLPPKRDLDLLIEAGKSYRSYAQLVKDLEELEALVPVEQMLCEYLREEGYVFEKEIDFDALMLLIVKSTGFPHTTGFRRLNTLERMTSEVPRTFRALLNNTAVIGNRFYDHIGHGIFRQRPTVDFRFSPYYNASKLLKKVKKEKETDPIRIDNGLVDGGEFWVTASVSFPGGDGWLNLRFGFYFYVTKGKAKKNALESYVYAEISGSGGAYEEESVHISLGQMEDEDWVYGEILGAMKTLITKCVKDQRYPVIQRKKALLQSLLKSLKEI